MAVSGARKGLEGGGGGGTKNPIYFSSPNFLLSVSTLSSVSEDVEKMENSDDLVGVSHVFCTSNSL